MAASGTSAGTFKRCLIQLRALLDYVAVNTMHFFLVLEGGSNTNRQRARHFDIMKIGGGRRTRWKGIVLEWQPFIVPLRGAQSRRAPRAFKR